MALKLKTVVSLSLGLFIFSQSNLQAVTAQKILARVRRNIEKAASKKITMNITLKMASGEEVKTSLTLLYRSPDKIKMQGDPPMPTIIISGEKMSIKFITGQVITKNLSSGDIQNIARPELGYNLKKFLELYKISLTREKSGKKDELYILELTPKDAGDKNTEKTRLFADYRKGYIYKAEIYDANGGITMSLNYTGMKMVNDILLPATSEMTMYSPNGNTVTYSTYDYSDINAKIPDSEFVP